MNVSPANFLALTTEADIDVLRKEIEAIEGFKATCASDEDPLVIGFGHYPLSVYARAHSVGVLGAISHALGGIRSLDHPIADILAQRANVYLCGHLHSLFGQLYRVHDARKEDEGGRLTELESAAWKDERSFRVLVVDNGCVAFANYYFLTPTSPHYLAGRASDLHQRQGVGWESSFADRGWGLTSHEARGRGVIGTRPDFPDGFSLHGTMVVVTTPTDASLPDLCIPYSSKHGPHDVRALVLVPSLNEAGGETKNEISALAILTSSQGDEIGSLPLSLDGSFGGGHQRLFVGSYEPRLAARLRAELVYRLHVEIRMDCGDCSDGINSTGRIIAVSPPRKITPDGSQIPLEQSFLEFITLYVNWANVAHRLYLLAIVSLISIMAFFGAGFRRKVVVGYLLYQVVGPLYVCDLLSQSWPFVAFQHGMMKLMN